MPHVFGTLPFAAVTECGPQTGPRVDTHAAAAPRLAPSGPPESATARAMVPWVPKDANLTRGECIVLELALSVPEHMCSHLLPLAPSCTHRIRFGARGAVPVLERPSSCLRSLSPYM